MIFCITFRNSETHYGNRWLSWRIFWVIHDLINEWKREILTFWSKMIFFCYTTVHFRIPQTSQNLPFHSWSTNVCNYIKSSTNIYFFDVILYWDTQSTNIKLMFAIEKNVETWRCWLILVGHKLQIQLCCNIIVWISRNACICCFILGKIKCLYGFWYGYCKGTNFVGIYCVRQISTIPGFV